jgi:alpha-1,3-rhamnosyl/mannosyltransferase
MRVLMNGVSALKPRTGVGHTTAHLHRALAGLGTRDEFWLYPGSVIGGLARRLLMSRRRAPSSPERQRQVGQSQVAEAPGSPRERNRWGAPLKALAKAAYRVHLQTVARWGRFDLYHEPNFVPFRTHLPTVVTVHDLSVLLYPEWHPADRVRFHERHFRNGIRQADHVIVVSESVRREVIAELGLPPDRVTAVLNGIGDHYAPQPPDTVAAVQRALGLPPRYFLAVGTIEPRKNVFTLLRAFCDLPAPVRETCPLVLAGGWGWKSDPERELFENEARHRGAFHLGYVADGDLPGLYAGSAALLYPSYYEGFGLPPVEMLACGGAVVASTAAAVREVVGGHAELLDPHDLAGWRDAMHRIATDDAINRLSCHGGIAHARQFTWDAAARRTLDVYRRVLGIASAPPLPSSRAA